MKVLSLFDGMSCGMIALERAGIPVECYYASEIDKHAIKVSEANYPGIIRLGDVTKIDTSTFPKIDLLIGGSPCQGLSFAGKQLNFEDPRSKLFFEFVRVLKELRKINPDIKFMLENVKMKKEYQDVITQALGVNPVFIDSNLFSGQNRKRYYWTNIGIISLPTDKGILLKDILINGFDDRYKAHCLDANYHKVISEDQYHLKSRSQIDYLTARELELCEEKYKSKIFPSGHRRGNMKFPDNINKKSRCLTATVIKVSRESMHINDGYGYRLLYPVECERLQTVPENYTVHVSNTQRYRMLGNGWTIDVIAHIFKGLKPPHQTPPQAPL